MALGSLIDGSGQLKAAADQLEATWVAAKDEWHDANSRSLEEQHLEPLFTQVRTTLDAIARLNGVLITSCRECQDRE